MSLFVLLILISNYGCIFMEIVPDAESLSPEIRNFTPKTGPWEGGTRITITGINLGQEFNDIKEIKVAEVNCRPDSNNYIKSQLIVCTLDNPKLTTEKIGQVCVEFKTPHCDSQEDFQFVNPTIKDFKPKFGPIGGGTLIQIEGTNLNAGSSITAKFNEISCEILAINETVASCRTSSSPTMGKGFLEMQFDNAKRKFNDYKFEYVENPEIFNATTTTNNGEKFPKGFPSGGINVTVYGQRFKYIQTASMYVYYDNRKFYSNCVIRTDLLMDCITPKIKINAKLQPTEKPMNLEYGFEMDNVTLNLTTKGEYYQLFTDPTFFKLNVKTYDTKYLIIRGRNLSLACSVKDISLKIGDQYCKIISLTREAITCDPPTEVAERNEFEVVIKIGSKLEFTVKVQKYSSSLAYILGFSVLGAVLIVAIGFTIAYFIKKKGSSYHLGKLGVVEEIQMQDQIQRKNSDLTTS